MVVIPVLRGNLDTQDLPQTGTAGREELIGKTAVVKIALAPKGVVLVEGERWTAVIDKGRAEPEEEVIITKVDGLKLMVTKKQ